MVTRKTTRVDVGETRQPRQEQLHRPHLLQPTPAQRLLDFSDRFFYQQVWSVHLQLEYFLRIA